MDRYIRDTRWGPSSLLSLLSTDERFPMHLSSSVGASGTFWVEALSRKALAGQMSLDRAWI